MKEEGSSTWARLLVDAEEASRGDVVMGLSLFEVLMPEMHIVCIIDAMVFVYLRRLIEMLCDQ
jgi:hypothetical protein